MGWKGALRSVAAAARAAEREAQRRHKQQVKAEIASDAAEAVADWETHINDLISIHTDLTDAIDWQSLAATEQPVPPGNSTINREYLAPKLRHFKPGIFDFLSGGTARRKKKLIDAFEKAKKKDLSAYKIAKAKHARELAEWESDTSMARRLISGEVSALREVVNEMQTLSADGLIGAEVQFRFEHSFVHAIPQVHTDEVVPNFRRKQLASGRLSETKMPVGEFNELYQDYVASVALRVAGDLFHILPSLEVYVTCQTIMLDKQTGHQKPTPILSVQFVRETFMNLNLTSVDPSDALRNFNHEMNFKRNAGFDRIDPLRSCE